MVDQMTPRWQWSFVTCANLVISTVAYAQPPLTIDSAVAQALIHNVGMAQTRATVAGKQEDLRAAQLMDRPTVGVELTALRGSGEPTSFSAVNGQSDPNAPAIKPITGNYGAGTLVLRAPIFQNGAFFFQESPAESMANGNLLKARSDSDTQAVELSNQVAKAYLSALSVVEQLSLQQSAAEKLRQRLEIVHVRVRGGLSSVADELSTKAALAEKNSDLNAARRSNSLLLMQLSLALGQEQNSKIEITPVTTDFPYAPAIEETLKNTLDAHPALQSQMANLRVAKSVLDSQRAENSPKVVFDITRTEAGNFYDTGTNQFVSAGVKLSMPLLDFGQGNAKIRARSYEVQESEQKTLQTRTTIIQNAYQAYYAYQDAVDKFEAGKATLDRVEFQERGSAAKRAKRMIGLETLLQDEASALTARVNQVKLRYEAWIAWTDFVKSLGRPYSSNLFAGRP